MRGLVVGGKSVARSRVTQAQSKREQKVTKSRLSPFGDTFLPEKKTFGCSCSLAKDATDSVHEETQLPELGKEGREVNANKNAYLRES